MRLVRQRPMPAAFKTDRVAGRTRRLYVEGMCSTRAPTDAPARGGRAGRRKAWIGDEEARRRMLRRNETQPAGRCQLHFAHHADDECEALRPQPLFHRPQRIAGACRLDEQRCRGVETKTSQPGAMRGPQLMRERGWPAPQKPRRGGTRSRKTFKTPDSEAHGKAEHRRPIAGSHTGAPRRGLHLVQGGKVEPAPQIPIDIGCTKGPGRGRLGSGSRLHVRGATLERGDGRPQTFEHPGLAVARQPAPRSGEEGLAVPVRARALKPNATQPITQTLTGAWLWPRDPWQTAGRWGGGWDRLFHGYALAPTERRRDAVAFVFCSKRPHRNRQDQKGNKSGL